MNNTNAEKSWGRTACELFRQHETKLAVAVALLSSLLVFLFFINWAYDDPFITYRYAANLAQGQGFVYNAGEHVLSTTTPLFTLLLAAVAWLSGGQSVLSVAANLIGTLSLGAGGLLMWKLGRRWEAPLAGWSALLLYPIFPLLVNTLGSETPLYLAFCLGSLACYAYDRYDYAAVFAGLATLTRPDGILIAFILAAHLLINRRKLPPWSAVLWFGLPLLAWVAFAWSYFGSPIPVTLAAKQSQAEMQNAQTFAPGLLTVLEWFKPWQYAIELILALAGMVVAFFRKRAWLLLVGWAIVYFLAYSLLNVSRYFWYYAPLVPAFVALVGLGLWAIETLGWVKDKSGRNYSISFTFVTAGLIAFLLITQATSLQGLANQPDSRSEVYRQVGNWLKDNTPEHVTVGSLETGIIGFYAQRRMVDFAGLLYPDIAESLQAGTFEQAAQYAVEQYHPDVLVLQEGLFPVMETGYLPSNCRQMMRFSDENYPYTLVLYNCQ
jgi:hypothetical protein